MKSTEKPVKQALLSTLDYPLELINDRLSLQSSVRIDKLRKSTLMCQCT